MNITEALLPSLLLKEVMCAGLGESHAYFVVWGSKQIASFFAEHKVVVVGERWNSLAPRPRRPACNRRAVAASSEVIWFGKESLTLVSKLLANSMVLIPDGPDNLWKAKELDVRKLKIIHERANAKGSGNTVVLYREA